MSSVLVRLEGRIIHAIYAGTMTRDLVREGERQIEEAIERLNDALLLYDTLEMKPPSIELALRMKSFAEKTRARVLRSASVVHASGAFLAKLLRPAEHRIFYDDLEAAYTWLRNW